MRVLGKVVLGAVIAIAGLGCAGPAGPSVVPTDDGVQANRPRDLVTPFATRNPCDDLWAQYLSSGSDDILDQLIANGCQRGESSDGSQTTGGPAPTDGERLAVAAAVAPLLQQHSVAEIAEKDAGIRKTDAARTDMLMSQMCWADQCSSSATSKTTEGQKLDAARPYVVQLRDLITSVRAKGTPDSLAADTKAINDLGAKMCAQLGCKGS